MEVAAAGAVSMEDLAIESVGTWAGTAADFGEGVWGELFTPEREIKPLFQSAALELMDSSLLRHDITGIMVSMCRLAASQWFLRQAHNKYAKS